MAEITIRLIDKTHKAEIEVDDKHTASELIDTAIENWGAPTDCDYQLVNTSTNSVLNNNQTLKEQGITTGDILKLQPILNTSNIDELVDAFTGAPLDKNRGIYQSM
jgi:uncharacterized ubiquitin-like protein YukD